MILRDIILLGKRHFRELLASNEGIFSNILADPGHEQRIIFSLTEKSIALTPVLAQMEIWGPGALTICRSTKPRTG